MDPLDRPTITLVLLPGLDGTGLLFRTFVDALPPTIKSLVIRYPIDRCLTYAELADIVFKQLPSDGPFILLGESFGGPLAVMLAQRCDENRTASNRRLIGLVLCATFITPPRPLVGRLVKPFVRPMPFRLYPIYKQWKARFGRSKASQAAMIGMASLLRSNVIASRVQQALHVDVSDALRGCEAPVLYLQATRDRIVPASSVRLIQQVRPDVRVIRIDSPHNVLQRMPMQCVDAIVQFANSINP